MTQQANIVSGLQKIIVVPNTQKVQIVGVVKGDTGLTGLTGATGPGVPIGGTANQVLSKINSTNYNTQWVTPVLASSNNAFTGANTFQSINGIVSFYSASTQDGVTILGRNGGSTSLRVSLVPAALTTNKTITLPDATGTAITTGNLSDITTVGTLTAGTIPVTLLSGIIASARISGSYTGLTGVGTLTAGSIPASLLTGTTLPATIVTSSLTTIGTLTAGAVPASLITGTTLPATIVTSSLTTIGTLTAGAVPASLITGTTLPATIVTSSLTSFGTVTSMTVNGANASSPGITIGDWNQNGEFTAIRSAYGYLIFGSGNGPNYNLYLRTETATGTVVIGGGGSASTANNTMVVGASSVSVAGTLTTSGQLSISRGSLGNTAGDSLTFINPNGTSNNGDSLNTVLSRFSTGTDWTTARWGIQRLVDTTYMGGILFGYYNWDLIVNTTSYLSGSSITGVMTAGVPISGYSFIGTNSGNQNNYVKLGTSAIDSTTAYGYTAYGNLRTTCGYGVGVSWYSNGLASPTGFVPNVHASFWAAGTSSGDIRSNANNTTAYNTTSDYRLKENIHDIDDAIYRVRKLHPVKFEFKDPDNDIVYDGFLAHEVQEVAPYAVSGEKDATGQNGEPMYQQIDTSWLIGLLTAGIQDIDKRLQLLENK